MNFWDAIHYSSDTTLYFIMGSVATLLFLARLVMALFGGDGDSGDFDSPGSPGSAGAGDMGGDAGDAHFDAHHHAHDDSTGVFKFFSLLSIMAFFMGAGWMGFAARVDWGFNGFISAVLSIGFGTVAMSLAAGMAFAMRRLNKTSKYDPAGCVGSIGQVYLTIPPKGQGQGQVKVTFGGTSRIVSATSNGPSIAAFQAVKIISAQANVLLVEPSQ